MAPWTRRPRRLRSPGARRSPPPTSILPLWGGGQTAARKGHGFPCRGTGMTARGAPMAPWTRRPRHLRSPRVGRSPHLNPPPLGRRPNGGEEGAWIPVSGYGNDGARRAYGSMASPISVGGKGGCRGEGLAAGGRSVRKWHGFPCRGTGMTERGGEEASGGGKGAWIPVSAHGNDGARRGRRPNGGEERAWIPVSGHGNDGARRGRCPFGALWVY